MKKRVSFESLHIREYNRTIGDNPSCSGGCPISIGWNIQREVSISVNAFEQSRAPRRERLEMKIPAGNRLSILHDEWHIPFSSIKEATLETKKERDIRSKSLQRHNNSTTDLIRKTKRKVRKWLKSRKDDSQGRSSKFGPIPYPAVNENLNESHTQSRIEKNLQERSCDMTHSDDQTTLGLDTSSRRKITLSIEDSIRTQDTRSDEEDDISYDEKPYDEESNGSIDSYFQLGINKEISLQRVQAEDCGFSRRLSLVHNPAG